MGLAYGVRHLLHRFYTKQRGQAPFTYKGHALLLFGFALDSAPMARNTKKAEIIMISAFSSS